MSRNGTVPPETFRIKPDPDDPGFFVVHVAKSLAAMRKATKEHLRYTHPKMLGYCVEVTSEEMPDLLGIIFLAQPLKGGVVVHELAHATFRALERRNVRVKHWLHTNNKTGPNGHASEEVFALMLENLTSNFWTEAYDRGLS
jgi:hypothetical protein